jgi:hypothetical protein
MTPEINRAQFPAARIRHVVIARVLDSALKDKLRSNVYEDRFDMMRLAVELEGDASQVRISNSQERKRHGFNAVKRALTSPIAPKRDQNKQRHNTWWYRKETGPVLQP